MERVALKSQNRSPYILLALMLVIAVLGTILFLGHGMDTDRFFISVSAPTCAYVLSLSFPVFVLLEFLGLMINGEMNYGLYPYAGEHHSRNLKISFAFSVLGLGIATFGYLTYQNTDPALSVTLISMNFVLGGAVYMGLETYDAYKNEKSGTKDYLMPMLYLASLVLLELVTVLLVYRNSVDFSMLFVGVPLWLICLCFIGRQDD